jgi:hypothetical protein
VPTRKIAAPTTAGRVAAASPARMHRQATRAAAVAVSKAEGVVKQALRARCEAWQPCEAARTASSCSRPAARRRAEENSYFFDMTGNS